MNAGIKSPSGDEVHREDQMAGENNQLVFRMKKAHYAGEMPRLITHEHATDYHLFV